MERLKHFDHALVISALVLVGIGIVMIYSSSSIMAQERFNDSFHFLKRQGSFVCIGILIMFVAMNIPYRYWKNMAYPCVGLSLLSLLALHIPGSGIEVSGATRWLRLSFLSFQPSEVAKVVLVIYLAYSLSKKKEKIKTFSIGFISHIVIVSVFLLLIIIEPDLGTALTIGLLAMTMMLVAGTRLIYLAITAIISIPLFIYHILHNDYQLRRIMAFLNPWETSTGSGYQIVQSFIAFGSGGLFGAGLGEGKQKLFYLPEPHTDFIFSVIGEELGFFGVLVVLFVFLVLITAGMRVALRARDDFGVLLALGLTSVIALGAIFNLSVVLGLIPTKGLTLPFISYGGTSLVVHLGVVGILVNIASRTDGGHVR
jgi:cell division protein FtsW